jgi:hypothetical protein
VVFLTNIHLIWSYKLLDWALRKAGYPNALGQPTRWKVHLVGYVAFIAFLAPVLGILYLAGI